MSLGYDDIERTGKWWLIRRWLNDHPNHAMADRARKAYRTFKRIYRRITRARRQIEVGNRRSAITIYKRIYRSYKQHSFVVDFLRAESKRQGLKELDF